MAPTVTLDAESHVYRLATGQQIPGVTEVLGGCGLIDYSFIPAALRDEYLDRGRLVHEATALYDIDDLDESSVPEAIAGYLAAWKSFRTERLFTPSEIEVIRYNTAYGYCGTVDRYGIMPINGKYYEQVVLDIKTGTYPCWVKFQLAAYAAFAQQAQRRVCVVLQANGRYRHYVLPQTEQPKDFSVFMAALVIHTAKKEAK